MLDLGDTVHIGGTCRDAAGAPTNAATVLLTVRLPDGTDQVVPVANPPAVTGEYGVDYVPSVAGLHEWWLRTTNPGTALTGSFDVRAAFPGFVISLADAKAHLNKSAPDDDEELRPYVLTATEVIEEHLDECIVSRQVIDPPVRLDHHADRIILARAPVLSLVSVVALDGSRTWTVGDLHADGPTGVVTVLRGPRLCGAVVVTYRAGRGPGQIPERYKMAARMVVGALWATQRADSGSRRPALAGGVVVQSDGRPYRGADFPEAMRLLGASAPRVA